ncbi:MAG TPA: HmuY family protein, partial [Bacteroidia bacterium]|nr:HmuY family protein [Bacteroidia bacterium]
LDDDSTAVGNWIDAGQSKNETYVIDRGRTEQFGAARWRKMQIVSVNSDQYVIRFSLYNNTQLTEFTIPKNPSYSLMYFSFDDGGKMVSVAPEKDKWDIVFTKFTHTYYSEPVYSPYRYYIVTGGLLNRWVGDENEIAKQDSTPGFKPFDQVTAADMGNFTFHQQAALIGFSWKEYDFNLGYTIYQDRYYLVHDEKGYFYKIRFLDFYDDQGNKGAATFEYQRL